MKILIISLSILSLGSCMVLRENREKKVHMAEMHLSDSELARWYTEKDTIYQDSIAVGFIQSMEWEYSNSTQMQMEISVKQIDPLNGDITKELIKYVHMRQPRAKIEINYDR